MLCESTGENALSADSAGTWIRRTRDLDTHCYLVGPVAVVLLLICFSSGAMASAEVPESTTADSFSSADVTEVDSCTEITEPGVYRLTSDVEGTEFDCIEVLTDNVLIDGQGHTLRLDPETRDRWARMQVSSRGFRQLGVGVAVGGETPIRNVAVTNLTVSDWEVGVRYRNVSGGHVHAVTAARNVDGIALEDTVNSRVTRSNATLNSVDGIVFRNTTRSRIVGSTAHQNVYAGISLTDSDANAVYDVDVSENRGDGILLRNADRNTLSRLSVSGNAIGVLVFDGRNNEIVDAVVDGNEFAGIFIANSSGNAVLNAAVSNTSGSGSFSANASAVWLFNASDNSFDGIASANNTGWTIYSSDGSTRNSFRDLSIDDSGPISVTLSDVALGTSEDGTVVSADRIVLHGVAVVATGPNGSIRIASDDTDRTRTSDANAASVRGTEFEPGEDSLTLAF